MQRHHILMQELENGVTSEVNQKFHRLVSILHDTASLKAILPFDYVNTSGQKPCILPAHFTRAYGALDTLPNHYINSSYYGRPLKWEGL